MADILIYLVVILVVFQLYGWIKLISTTNKLNHLQDEYLLQAQLLENLQFNQAQLTDQNDQLAKQLAASTIENEQVTNQLTHRTKVLQQRIDEHKESIEKINQQQPEDKLYSRALKLVKLGADVEEIMRECELPRAEAELLISMHLR